jgi:hypothetical protein
MRSKIKNIIGQLSEQDLKKLNSKTLKCCATQRGNLRHALETFFAERSSLGEYEYAQLEFKHGHSPYEDWSHLKWIRVVQQGKNTKEINQRGFLIRFYYTPEPSKYKEYKKACSCWDWDLCTNNIHPPNCSSFMDRLSIIRAVKHKRGWGVVNPYENDAQMDFCNAYELFEFLGNEEGVKYLQWVKK